MFGTETISKRIATAASLLFYHRAGEGAGRGLPPMPQSREKALFSLPVPGYCSVQGPSADGPDSSAMRLGLAVQEAHATLPPVSPHLFFSLNPLIAPFRGAMVISLGNSTTRLRRI